MNEWSVWSVDTKQKQLYSLKLTSEVKKMFSVLHSPRQSRSLTFHGELSLGSCLSHLHITSLYLFQFSACLLSFSLYSPSLHLFLFL